MKLKKMLAAVLTMAMVATALPVTAFAATVNSSKDLAAAVANAGSEAVVIELASGEYATNFKVDGGKDITIKAAKGAEVVLSGQIATTSSTEGKLTLENVTYKVDNSIVDSTGISQTGKSAIAIWGNQTVICNNVTFDMSKDDSSAITAWWDTGIGTTIECYNCTFNCNGQRPVRATGNVTMDNCTFNDPYRYAVQLTAKASTATLLDKAIINFTNNTIVNGVNGKAFVYGIQLEGEEYGCNDLVINGSGNTIENGGEDSTMYFCECGKVKHESVFWNVEETPVCGVNGEAVAKVAYKNGAIYYATLKDAVAAAGNGDEITLLKTTEGSGIVIDKSITIDFGTHTYTVKDNAVGSTGTKTIGFQILEGNTVTLKNGTLTESTGTTGEQPHVVKMLVQNYADLTVEDMKLEGAGLEAGRYVLSNNCGNVVITGETYINAPAGGIAVDAYDYSDGGYDGVTVTFDKDFVGLVNGALELDADDADNANTKMIINSVDGGFKGNLDQKAGKLEISAGKFAANPAKFVANGFVARALETPLETPVGPLNHEVISADAYIPENPADVTQDTDADVPKADVHEEAVTNSEVSTELLGGKTVEQVVDGVANGLKGETGTLAAAETTSVLETVAAAVPAPTVSELQQAGVEVESETAVQVTVKPYMEVEVQSVVMTEEKKEIKLDIEAKYDVVVTQGSEVEDEPIVEGAKLDVKEIWITIPLPDGFAAPNSKIYVAHIKEDANGNKYVADKYEATVSGDGKTARFFNENGFSEFLVSGTDLVAEINGTTYTSLQAAVDAAGDGATIKLLGNTTGGGVKIPSGKNITIDFGGYTYKFDKLGVGSGTLTSNGFQILEGSTVVLKDGKLEVDSAMASEYYTLIQNYADLTVDGMTLDGTNLDKWAKHADQETNGDSYALSNNNGNVTITGDTTIIANNDGSKAFAFDVCDNDSYAGGVKVTIDGNFTGEIKGRIEVSDDSNEDGTTAELTIAGTGEFTSVPEIKTGVTADVEISSGIFGEEVPLDMLASDANRVTCADNSSVILTDADLAEGGAVGLVAGEKLVTDEGIVLLAVNKGAATYSNGIVSAEAGAEVMTANAGTVYFSNGGSIDASGNVDYVPNYGGTTNKVIGGGKGSDKTEDTDTPAETEKTLVLTIGQKIYQENGAYEVNDVAPIIQGERTFLPIRLIAEFLGATVTWNEAAQSVTITNDDTTIVIVIGLPYAMVNGERVELDAPAFISNDRTYLPVRFISENLGADVTWDGVLKTVTIVG